MTTKIETVEFDRLTFSWQTSANVCEMVIDKKLVEAKEIKKVLGVDIPNLGYIEDNITTTVRAKKNKKLCIEMTDRFGDDVKSLIEYQFNPRDINSEIIVRKQIMGEQSLGIKITRS